MLAGWMHYTFPEVCLPPALDASSPRGSRGWAGQAVTPPRRAGARGAPRVVLTEGERSRQKLFCIRCFGVSGPASPCLLIFPKYCCSRLALSSCVCAPRSEGQLSAPLRGWGGPSADAHAGCPWQSLACPPIPGATGSAVPSPCSLACAPLLPNAAGKLPFRSRAHPWVRRCHALPTRLAAGADLFAPLPPSGGEGRARCRQRHTPCRGG